MSTWLRWAGIATQWEPGTGMSRHFPTMPVERPAGGPLTTSSQRGWLPPQGGPWRGTCPVSHPSPRGVLPQAKVQTWAWGQNLMRFRFPSEALDAVGEDRPPSWPSEQRPVHPTETAAPSAHLSPPGSSWSCVLHILWVHGPLLKLAPCAMNGGRDNGHQPSPPHAGRQPSSQQG